VARPRQQRIALGARTGRAPVPAPIGQGGSGHRGRVWRARPGRADVGRRRFGRRLGAGDL